MAKEYSYFSDEHIESMWKTINKTASMRGVTLTPEEIFKRGFREGQVAALHKGYSVLMDHRKKVYDKIREEER